jgi:hypothetical protein
LFVLPGKNGGKGWKKKVYAKMSNKNVYKEKIFYRKEYSII